MGTVFLLSPKLKRYLYTSECGDRILLWNRVTNVYRRKDKSSKWARDKKTEIFADYNQQDATLHNLFISVRRCTCFRRFSVHHQELKTAHTASGTCLTNTWRCMCSFELLMMDGNTVWNM